MVCDFHCFEIFNGFLSLSVLPIVFNPTCLAVERRVGGFAFVRDPPPWILFLQWVAGVMLIMISIPRSLLALQTTQPARCWILPRPVGTVRTLPAAPAMPPAPWDRL